MKIHDCIKKAGKALDTADRDQLLENLPEKVKLLGEEEGSLTVIREMIFDLRMERSKLKLAIEDQGGEVPMSKAEKREEEQAEINEELEAINDDLNKAEQEWRDSIPENRKNEKAMVPPDGATVKHAYWLNEQDAANYAKAYGFDQAAAWQIEKSVSGYYVLQHKTNKDNKRWISVKENHGFVTLAERDRIWQAWQKSVEDNSRIGAGRMIISLFDRTGVWSQPFVDAGYDVVQVDVDHPVWAMDIKDINIDTLIDNGWEDVHGILAAPPCQHFSNACRGLWKIKDVDGRTRSGLDLVNHMGAMIDWLKPDFYAIENPSQSRINKKKDFDPDAELDLTAVEWMGDSKLDFHPHNYGDTYTKGTKLWGKFNSGLPQANVFPSQGSRIWKLTGYTKKDKQKRSVTPIGFSNAFFQANSPLSPLAVDMKDWMAFEHFDAIFDHFGDWNQMQDWVYEQVQRERTPEMLNELGMAWKDLDPAETGKELLGTKRYDDSISKFEYDRKVERDGARRAKRIEDRDAARTNLRQDIPGIGAPNPRPRYVRGEVVGQDAYYGDGVQKPDAEGVYDKAMASSRTFKDDDVDASMQWIDTGGDKWISSYDLTLPALRGKTKQFGSKLTTENIEWPTDADAIVAAYEDIREAAQDYRKEKINNKKLRGAATRVRDWADKKIEGLKEYAITERPGAVLNQGQYVIEAKEGKGWKDIGEGPFDSKAEAKKYADAEVGVEHRVVPIIEGETAPLSLTAEPTATEAAITKQKIKAAEQEEVPMESGAGDLFAGEQSPDLFPGTTLTGEQAPAAAPAAPPSELPVLTEDQIAKAQDAYSADTIAMKDRVRKPWKFNGKLYTSTGSAGIVGNRGVDLVELVPAAEWKEASYTYAEANLTSTSYKGIKVKYGKNSYVLGNKYTVQPDGTSKIDSRNVPKKTKKKEVQDEMDLGNQVAMNIDQLKNEAWERIATESPTADSSRPTKWVIILEGDRKGQAAIIVGDRYESHESGWDQNISTMLFNDNQTEEYGIELKPTYGDIKESEIEQNKDGKLVAKDGSKALEKVIKKGGKTITHDLSFLPKKDQATVQKVLDGKTTESVVSDLMNILGTPGKADISGQVVRALDAAAIFSAMGGTPKKKANEIFKTIGHKEKVVFGLGATKTQRVAQGAHLIGAFKEVIPTNDFIEALRERTDYLETKDIEQGGLSFDDFKAESRQIGKKETSLKVSKQETMKLLGENMYTQNLVDIAVKELAQNSFDAVKDSLYMNEIETGTIDISLNKGERTITVTDNGAGMTADTLDEVFFVVAKSYKGNLPPEKRSGGFGAAKVGTLGAVDSITVTTTKDGITSKVTATREELASDTLKFDINMFEAEPGARGTVVELKIPANYYDKNGYAKRIWFPDRLDSINFFNKPLIEENVVITYESDTEEKTVAPLGKNFDFSEMPLLTDVTFDWGTADIYFGTELKDSAKHYILSSGVYQFDQFFHTSFERIPYDIIVDVKPTVDAKHEDYPFEMDREKFKGRIRDDIDKLNEYISMTNLSIKLDDLVGQFDEVTTLPNVGIGRGTPETDRLAKEAFKTPVGYAPATKKKAAKKPIKKPSILIKKGKIIDTSTNEVIQEKKKKASFKANKEIKERAKYEKALKGSPNSPIFHNNTDVDYIAIGTPHGNPEAFFAELGSIFLHMRDAVAESGVVGMKKIAAEQLYFGGVSIDKGYAGVHIRLPFKGIFVNPFGPKWGATSPVGYTEVLYNTMVHEIAHVISMDHGVNHNTAQINLLVWLSEQDHAYFIREAIKDSVKKHQATYEVMNDAYNRSDTKNTGKSFKDYDENTEAGAAGIDQDKPAVKSRSVPAGKEQPGRGDLPAFSRPRGISKKSERILQESADSASGLNQDQTQIMGHGTGGTDYVPPTKPKKIDFSIARSRSSGLSVKQAKTAVRKAIGHKLFQRIEFYETVADVPDDVVGGGRQLLTEAGMVEGFVAGKKAYLITKNISSPERAAWVAWHEMWHRGAKIRYGQQFNRVLRRARENNVVNRLGNAINNQRDVKLSEIRATEEALAELHAAMRSGDYSRIYRQYGIKVPASMKSGFRAAVQGWLDAIRRIMRNLGAYLADQEARVDGEMTDLQISNLIRGVDLNSGGRIDSVNFSKQGRIDPFFSSLNRLVENADGMPAKGSAAQFKQWFNAAQRKGKLSKVEYEWLDIDGYLDRTDKNLETISRAMIQDYVKMHPMIIREQILESEQYFDDLENETRGSGEQASQYPAEDNNYNRAYLMVDNWQGQPQDGSVFRLVDRFLSQASHWTGEGGTVLAAEQIDTFIEGIEDNTGSTAVYRGAKEVAKEIAGKYKRDIKRGLFPYGSDTSLPDTLLYYLEEQMMREYHADTPEGRFDLFKTDDGVWRMMRGTFVYEETYSGPISGLQNWATEMIGPIESGATGRVRYEDETLNEPGGDYYRELLMYYPPLKTARNHFGEKGMFLHARFDERYAAGYKEPTKHFPHRQQRMIFIQELQADERKRVQEDREAKFDDILLTEGVPEDVKRAQAEIAEDTPATAPYFKPSDYTLLGMKRMIRFAVDNEFDTLGWTPGSMQNVRWGNTRTYSEVKIKEVGMYSVEPNSEPRYEVTSRDGRMLTVNTIDSIRDKFGNDVAVELLADGNATVRDFTEDTESAKGMYDAYDKIPISVMNKFLKKYKAKVEPFKPFNTTTPAAELEAQLWSELGRRGIPDMSLAELQYQLTSQYDSTFVAINELSPDSKAVLHRKAVSVMVAMEDPLAAGVHQIRITEELAAAAKTEGFPLSVAPEEARFRRPEVEERWNQSGQPTRPDGMVQKFKDRANDIKINFQRHYKDLPVTPEFAEVTEQLRKLEAAPDATKDQVLRLVKLVTENMTPKDLDLFTRKVVLDDLQYEITLDHKLPMDLTPEEVHETLGRIDRLLVNRPDIIEAVESRRVMVNSIADQLVEAGVLTEDQIKNPYYFRHQVLEYMAANKRFGKRRGVKTPKQAGRKGSLKDINVNYLEVEFEWLNKALNDIATADTISWIKESDHNVRQDAVEAGRESNTSLYNSALRQDLSFNGYDVMAKDGVTVLRRTSPLNEEAKAYKRRIAMGLKEVREGLDNATFELPAIYQDVASDIIAEESGQNPMFYQFLGWLAQKGKEGSKGAKMVFSAINQRKAWKKELLGEAYVNTQSMAELVQKGFAPEGYVLWQPDKGKMLFTAQTISEHVVDAMLLKVAEEPGSLTGREAEMMLNSIRSMLAVGGPKYQMIIPEELAATLDGINDEQMGGLIRQSTTELLTMWKRWQLISPWRIAKYNINNLSGDLDAIIAVGPKIVKKLPQAISELWYVMYGERTSWLPLRKLKPRPPSDRYNEAVRRGVFGSGLTLQEIKKIDEMADFKNIFDRPEANVTSLAGAKEIFSRIGKGLTVKPFKQMQKFTWFRENWMRYAAYLHYSELLDSGHQLTSIEYGASRPEILDSISDNKDKAALMARQAVGDYGAISHYGSHIRQNVFPFWSWVEINAKRYTQLIDNAMEHNIWAGVKSGSLVGATIGLKGGVWLTMRALALYATVQMWNQLMFGDDEEDLTVQEKMRLHVNLGRDKDGKVRMLRFQGALSDWLDWFGFGDAIDAMSEVESGRAKWPDVVTSMLKAPINKFVGGMTPVIKVPFESMLGYQVWPDVFHPRRIRDKGRYAASLWALEHEYDALLKRPSPDYKDSLSQLVVRKRDPGQSSYNRIRSAVYEWREKITGKGGSSSFSTPKSEAMYDYRLAKKFGDKDAEKAAFKRVVEFSANKGEAMKSIRGYAKKSSPLAMLSKKEKREFMKTLSPHERRLLRRAERWHKDTFR